LKLKLDAVGLVGWDDLRIWTVGWTFVTLRFCALAMDCCRSVHRRKVTLVAAAKQSLDLEKGMLNLLLDESPRRM
jgi:hypothetical protein